MPSLALDIVRLVIGLLAISATATLPRQDLAKLQTAKNVGLAALEEGDLAESKKRFEAVRRLAPEEPLGWANGAVAALREKDAATAKSLLEKALSLAPDDPQVLSIEATRRELAGQRDAAIEAYGKAAAADRRDLASAWSAARLELEKGDAGLGPARRFLAGALEQAPTNLFLLLRLAELERSAGERQRASAAAARVEAAVESADPKLIRYFGEAKSSLAAGNLAAASLAMRIVENLLRGSPRFQQARHDVDPGVVGLPLETWSPALSARIRGQVRAVPVAFRPAQSGGIGDVAGAASVRVFGKDGRGLLFAGAGGIAVVSLRGERRVTLPAGSGARAVEVADVDNSGELDVLTPGAVWLAGKGDFRKSPLPGGDRALPFDYDSDGDLDVYLSSRGGDRLLRNNLDGSWKDVTATALPPATASGAACAGDFDRDGDTDVVLVAQRGGLVLLDNLRGGRLAPRAAGLPATGSFLAVEAGDLNGDGRADLVWTSETAAFVSRNRGDGTFLPASALPAGGVPVLFDFDNDGFPDLFLASPGGSALFRNDGSGGFTRIPGTLPPAVDAAAIDADGDGDLDLALVTPTGGALLLENDGGNANGWIDVALEGLPTGSAKVNRFGFGSEVEVKAGDLYVYQRVSRPITHAGIGDRRRADVLRVLWSNGIPQNALAPAVRTQVREVQQLKGSCPFVYAFDGRRWCFVTDALGRSPVGLLYDGVHQAVADPREWLLVPGNRLAPVAGRLRLDFTEELWETMYLDRAELRAVDHPRGVELVPDEKMVPPPFPEKTLLTVRHPLVPRARDEAGRDRTDEIARADGRYLAGFAPTRYQGIVAPHEVVLELGQARRASSVRLFLTGWILYTDTSINVSLSQGNGVRPFGPTLDVPDGKGGWKAAIPAMGYPAGKTKTMAVDLSRVLDRGDPRVRIRTNLAIFWDRIVYTVDEGPVSIRQTPAPLAAARLFFRGFSARTRESPDGPDVFVHDEVDTTPRWADMAGYYTRFGDVRGLLTGADDRSVVMKGGDAVRLEFDARALPPTPPGWERDWLLVLDGWDKDADKNTVAGQTVEPLPFRAQDAARYGSADLPRERADRELSRRDLRTRRGGPEEFRDWLRGNAPR